MKIKFKDFLKINENTDVKVFNMNKEEFRKNMQKDKDYLVNYLSSMRNSVGELCELLNQDYITKEEFKSILDTYESFDGDDVITLLENLPKKFNKNYIRQLIHKILYEKWDEMCASLIIKIYRNWLDIVPANILKDLCHSYWNDASNKNNTLSAKCSEYGAYLLWSYKLITDKMLADIFNDLSIINGKLALVLKDWGDLSPVCYQSRDIDMDKMFKIVMTGEPYFEWYYYELDDIDYIWDAMDLEDQWKVVNKMEGESFTTTSFDEQTFDKTKVFVKDKYLYYKLEDEGNSEEMAVSTLLEECKDDFSDLWDALTRVYNYAKQSADDDELWKKCNKQIVRLLGEWERIKIKDEEKYDDGERMVFFNPDFSFYEGYDEKYVDFDNEDSANYLTEMGNQLESRDKLDVDTGNISGDITNDHITDELEYRLENI